MADTPSLADRLRETRNRLTEEREPKTFELPAYGSGLQVKYRPLTRDERKKGLQKVAKGALNDKDRVAENAMCRDLGLACLGFYTEIDEKTVPLHEAEGLGDDPITWGDPRLAEVLGIDLSTVEQGGTLQARLLIQAVLGNNDDALETHHNRVSRWMEQGWDEDDETF